jgi:hypothetical protein
MLFQFKPQRLDATNGLDTSELLCATSSLEKVKEIVRVCPQTMRTHMSWAWVTSVAFEVAANNLSSLLERF